MPHPQQGYHPSTLLPIFKKANIRALAYNTQKQSITASHTTTSLPPQHQKSTPPCQVFFHLQYHPQDPTPKQIHQLWNSTVTHSQVETLYNYSKMSMVTNLMSPISQLQAAALPIYGINSPYTPSKVGGWTSLPMPDSWDYHPPVIFSRLA